MMRSVQQQIVIYLLTVLVTVVWGNVVQDTVSNDNAKGTLSIQPEVNVPEKPLEVKYTAGNGNERTNSETKIKPGEPGLDIVSEEKLNKTSTSEKLQNENQKEVQVGSNGSQSVELFETSSPEALMEHKNVLGEKTSIQQNTEPMTIVSTNSTTMDSTKEKPLKLTADTSQVQEESKSEEKKVTYNGYKVLRVVLQNKEQKRMLRQLENNGDINTWMGNGTAVDILIRQNNVFDLLKERKLVYDIVIDDLQKAIEEENPPIAEDEWSELEGRKERNGQWMGNGFLSPYHYWMFSGGSRMEDCCEYDEHELIGLRRKKIKKKIKKKKRRRKKGHRMTWQMYHRMADIHGYLDYLTATYPDVCSQEIIGYSVEKKPLKVLKISSGKENSRAIWVDSGIHAREWITPATSTYIINQMVENGDGAHGVDWYFLPLVNPDGYEHSHSIDRLWRKNRANPYRGPCAGIDLNRNFGYRWGGQGSSQLPCRETYAGQGPFSEPETNAIKEFVLKKSKDLKAYISLHSYGQYILYPWGYDRKVPPDYSDLHRVGRAMAQAMKSSGGQNYKVGSAAATLYPAAGGSDDWAKGTAKIKYAYTIELRDTGRHGFVLPAQYILPTAQETYAALKILASEVLEL